MTRKSPKRDLTDEDRVLWATVARTATPLRGKRHPVAEEPPAEAAPPPAAPSPTGSPAEVPGEWTPSGRTSQLRPRRIDEPTREKIAKGRVPLEARVDLHGLTQRQAHALLLSFLQRAHALGVRYVLVITGKGSSSGSDGVLRQQVPDWLATPAFRDIVGGFDAAARRHGGQGAYYIRLRRAQTGTSR